MFLSAFPTSPDAEVSDWTQTGHSGSSDWFLLSLQLGWFSHLFNLLEAKWMTCHFEYFDF